MLFIIKINYAATRLITKLVDKVIYFGSNLKVNDERII